MRNTETVLWKETRETPTKVMIRKGKRDEQKREQSVINGSLQSD